MFHSLQLSGSGLAAQRARMDTIAANIANVHTTQNEQGEPEAFRRLVVLFRANEAAATQAASAPQGVGVKFEVAPDQHHSPRRVADPNHPDAVDGVVAFPNIELNTEFVNAVEASRAYEANLAAMDVSKQMFGQTLRLLT